MWSLYPHAIGTPGMGAWCLAGSGWGSGRRRGEIQVGPVPEHDTRSDAEQRMPCPLAAVLWMMVFLHTCSCNRQLDCLCDDIHGAQTRH